MLRPVVRTGLLMLSFPAFAHAAEPNREVVTAADTCATLLTIETRPDQDLPPTLRELSEDLAEAKSNRHEDYINYLRRKLDELVAENRITADQAEQKRATPQHTA